MVTSATPATGSNAPPESGPAVLRMTFSYSSAWRSRSTVESLCLDQTPLLVKEREVEQFHEVDKKWREHERIDGGGEWRMFGGTCWNGARALCVHQHSTTTNNNLVSFLKFVVRFFLGNDKISTTEIETKTC